MAATLILPLVLAAALTQPLPPNVSAPCLDLTPGQNAFLSVDIRHSGEVLAAVVFRLDGDRWRTASLSATQGSRYRAELPSAAAKSLDYYVEASDLAGGPPARLGAPSYPLHVDLTAAQSCGGSTAPADTSPSPAPKTDGGTAADALGPPADLDDRDAETYRELDEMDGQGSRAKRTEKSKSRSRRDRDRERDRDRDRDRDRYEEDDGYEEPRMSRRERRRRMRQSTLVSPSSGSGMQVGGIILQTLGVLGVAAAEVFLFAIAEEGPFMSSDFDDDQLFGTGLLLLGAAARTSASLVQWGGTKLYNNGRAAEEHGDTRAAGTVVPGWVPWAVYAGSMILWVAAAEVENTTFSTSGEKLPLHISHFVVSAASTVLFITNMFATPEAPEAREQASLTLLPHLGVVRQRDTLRPTVGLSLGF